MIHTWEDFSHVCITVGGDTHLKGNTEIDKDLTIHGNETVDGNSHIKGSQEVDGNSTVHGSQTVDGDSYIKGSETVDKKLTVGDDATFNKDATVNGITSTGALISRGDAAIGGNTHAYGDLILDGRFFAKGAAIFNDNVGIAKNLTVGGDTHVAGNATADGDIYGRSFNVGNERYIDNDGINTNGHAIRNVADGEISPISKDAVNGSQLYNAVQFSNSTMTARMDSLKSRLTDDINKVGAGAAAMANLHPMEYKRNDKVSVAAAVGNYKDTTAMAVGAFYRPDAKSMVSVSGSVGSNDNMVGIGYSQRFGEISEFDGMTDEELKNALSEMSDDMKTVKQENIALKEQLAKMNSRMEALTARLDSLSPATK